MKEKTPYCLSLIEGRGCFPLPILTTKIPLKEHNFTFQITNWDPIRFNPIESLYFAKWSSGYPNRAQLNSAQLDIIFIYRPVVRCFLFADIESFAKSVKAKTMPCTFPLNWLECEIGESKMLPSHRGHTNRKETQQGKNQGQKAYMPLMASTKSTEFRTA